MIAARPELFAASAADQIGDTDNIARMLDLQTQAVSGLDGRSLTEFYEQFAVELSTAAARAAHITVVLGTERVTERGLQIAACVIDPDGTIAGWQGKGQLDPSEEATYPAVASERSSRTAVTSTPPVPRPSARTM